MTTKPADREALPDLPEPDYGAQAWASFTKKQTEAYGLACYQAGAASPRAETPVGLTEAVRLAYKTGYDEGYSDASDGLVDHDACEEGWQQYLASHPEAAPPQEPSSSSIAFKVGDRVVGRIAEDGTVSVDDPDAAKHFPQLGKPAPPQEGPAEPTREFGDVRYRGAVEAVKRHQATQGAEPPQPSEGLTP